jgi:hypothetical protein
MDAKRRRNLIIAIIIVAIIAIIANVLAQQQKRPSYEQIDITPTRIFSWCSNDCTFNGMGIQQYNFARGERFF